MLTDHANYNGRASRKKKKYRFYFALSRMIEIEYPFEGRISIFLGATSKEKFSSAALLRRHVNNYFRNRRPFLSAHSNVEWRKKGPANLDFWMLQIDFFVGPCTFSRALHVSPPLLLLTIFRSRNRASSNDPSNKRDRLVAIRTCMARVKDAGLQRRAAHFHPFAKDFLVRRYVQ